MSVASWLLNHFFCEMVVSPLVIPFVLDTLICTYLTPECFLLMIPFYIYIPFFLPCINRCFCTIFFPHSVAEFYSLQPIFYFINQASARCNLTITASRKSPCEDPIMEMNQSPIPLLPTPPTHCSYRHHLSLKTESVET